MYKIFTLAAIVAVVPVTRQNLPASFNNSHNEIAAPYLLSFKNVATKNILEPANNTQPWSQNWMAEAQENIRKTEYQFTWVENLNAYCTPNRKNNLRFYYTHNGFTVQPRITKIPVEAFDPFADAGKTKYRHIPNWKVKFNLDKKQVGKGKWQIVNNTAAYITEKITVQYINNDEGMRQNFIVHTPLSNKDELKINFSVKTKLRTRLSNDQLQFFHKKNNVLNYDELKVWDAAGRTLKASFKQKNKNKFYIEVDTKDALYPITIDPISTTPAAMVESDQVNANLGFSVAGAGDVNGDGYSDVITGASGYDGGLTDEGASFIYHGSAAGISIVAAATVEGNQVNARMGIAVSTAGDVNRDGYSDIVVGVPFYDNSETDEGAAFIYHGSNSGIITTPAIILENNQALAQMGFSVACAGDVNNDGYSDVIAGAWLFDNNEVNEGVAFVYHGSSTGISGTIATTLEANQSASNYGISVAGAGDVNGDGFSDVIVGAENFNSGQTEEGVMFIYHGSAGGVNNVAATMAESNQGFSQFGFSVSTAGDVNGDGYSDVIVGAYTFDNVEINEGVAFIYHGAVTGVNNIAADTLECNLVYVQFGVSVACAGDINGDGYSDIVCGANLYDNVETNEGAAYVYFGSAAGINNTAAAILESNQADANFGRAVASAGDVNGDGYSDVIVGASQFDNTQTNEGAAFVYHGAAAGINIQFTTAAESNQADANMGFSVAWAGDVNADGYSDVIVGVPYYDNPQPEEGVAFIYHGAATGINAVAASMVQSNQSGASLGFSVAGAGDVNGDGYSDIIVGAPYYNAGSTDEGGAFIYHGSASGINTTVAAIVESNQANANLGFSVASAGDVNGDGYNDVIAGAYRYDAGEMDEGGAFVYHGSAAGINISFAIIVQANQASAYFGYFVAGAGSVNADGYSDIIIGAPLYDNGETDEGAAFVYHGSSAGINAVAAAMVQPDQTDARMGFSVSAAGDVNADGYGDVIVGAYNYDNSQIDQGRAFIYHGSTTGISTTANVVLEVVQANAYFGFSVACAGDVNGDGYADVIVGAYNYDNGETNEGAAFVYQGSTTGINATPASMVESNQANAILGYAVAGAGDVNGDGYSDVIAGAYGYDGGALNEGAYFIYQGNSPGANKRNNLRLYNNDMVTPINSSNFLLGNFGAGLFARSFLGRSKGKLVWETRLNYNAYSGTPITNSTFFTTQQSSYADLGTTGTELKDVISKLLATGRYTKLRARVKYNPATSITGQVYGPWRNVSSIIDANSLGALPVELISFNGAWLQKGKNAKLDFKTDKESGICCFDIEKSLDGFNFYSIGTVPAKNMGGILSYTFIDNNATGKKQYYRLKIKAITGQIDYSNIQLLQNNSATEIMVFPNPTTDVLNLRLNNAYDKLTIQIFNSSGQLVKRSEFSGAIQSISIPVQNLAAGQYWLHLQSREEKQVMQFIKR